MIALAVSPTGLPRMTGCDAFWDVGSICFEFSFDVWATRAAFDHGGSCSIRGSCGIKGGS